MGQIHVVRASCFLPGACGGRMDRNGPCKSLKLGNFVDREIGAIWWWRGWIPPLRRSRGRRWRKRIGAEMMGLVVALSHEVTAFPPSIPV